MQLKCYQDFDFKCNFHINERMILHRLGTKFFLLAVVFFMTKFQMLCENNHRNQTEDSFVYVRKKWITSNLSEINIFLYEWTWTAITFFSLLRLFLNIDTRWSTWAFNYILYMYVFPITFCYLESSSIFHHYTRTLGIPKNYGKKKGIH